MATKNFKLILRIRQVNGDGTYSDLSSGTPVAIRDVDEELSWIVGAFLANSCFEFNVPSGHSCGWKFAVETSSGNYTEDLYLSGTISGNNLGAHLAPMETIEDA